MIKRKNPKEMVDIELLETYGYYTRMGFRLQKRSRLSCIVATGNAGADGKKNKKMR